jgi:hypothetical protein
VPTLVLHTQENNFIRLAQCRYLAEQIDGAHLVEFPGSDLGAFAEDATQIVDEITEFLTEKRPAEIERVPTV